MNRTTEDLAERKTVCSESCPVESPVYNSNSREGNMMSTAGATQRVEEAQLWLKGKQRRPSSEEDK